MNKSIKANVVYNWNHPNHKFFPGDEVKVVYVTDTESDVLRSKVGRSGKVIARSATKDGLARGHNTRYGRCFTRYYVEFSDGNMHGYHSSYLDKVLQG